MITHLRTWVLRLRRCAPVLRYSHRFDEDWL